MINVIKVTVGVLETNCYLVYSEGGHRAVCIDPGDDGLVIKEKATDANLKIEGILLTHGHFDHIGEAAVLSEGEIPVYIHPLDAEMLSDSEKNESVGFGVPPVTVNVTPLAAEEGSHIELAGLDFEVWHTPGHSKGSVCYKTEDLLFTGDTMFSNGYGRTDLYGSSFEDMKKSLKRLLPFRKEYKIYPGHG